MIKSVSFFYKSVLIFLFTSAIFYQNTYCQTISKLNWITDSEFLPQNSIKSIVPDKYGFIWMTTENGLVRYDGKNFVIYNSQNMSLKNNRFVYITGNYQTDSLYTNNDGEEQYIFINQRKPTLVDLKIHTKATQLKNGIEDRFTSNGSPSTLFDFPKRSYHIPLLSKNYYFIDSDRIRFFDSKNKLVFDLKFEYESNSNFFTIGDVLFYMKKDGTYAIIKNGSIQWHHLGTDPKEEVRLYWNIVSDQVFIYSNRNLYEIGFDKELKKTLLLDNEDLIVNRVASIYFDRTNKITYLGSSTKGLCIYKSKSFNTIIPSESEKSEVFYALIPYDHKTIISASGIIIDDKKIIENLNLLSEKYGMALDQHQNIWTYKGMKLIRYTKNSNYKEHQEWDFQKEITSLFMDQNGSIWFSLLKDWYVTGTLYSFVPNDNPVFKKYPDIDFLPKFYAQNDADFLLIGSNKGAYKLDIKNKKVFPIPETEDLKVRSILLTDKNLTWITTYEKGFFLIKNGKRYSFPLDNNGYLSSSHCIMEDSKGFFWISTNKGLFQVKKQILLDYTEKKVATIYYHYYDKSSGFLTNEFNGGCQPCATKIGSKMYFPSINGVVTFDPNTVRPILPKDNIFIDEALVDDKRVYIKDTLNLDRKFGRVTFYITSPYYGNMNNLNFEVKLDGNDNNQWTKISNDNNISFTTLSPGEYKLIVRKLSDFDSKYEYKSITLIIEPAFWETLWFKTIIIALAILIGAVLYYLRIRFITKKNLLLEKKINEQTSDLKNTIGTLRTTKENLNNEILNNTKIIQYITHDIKSPLKFMSMASKYMYDTFDEKNEDLKENIQSIYTSSSQMYNFIDNLLEYSKTYSTAENLDLEEFKLYQVINQKIDFFETIAHYKKTIIINEVKENVTLVINKQLFTIIIHNLLDNAVKNTFNGKILFTSFTQEDKINIVIKDSGRGMNQQTLNYYKNIITNYNLSKNKDNKKLGLFIILELLIILNGKIKIESEENKGTSITITFDRIKINEPAN